jgi:outer membrane protein OmpA-like peptidoglycan-associated protein
MRARIALAASALAVLCIGGVAKAEPIGRHFEFTQFGGYTVFDKDRNALTNTDLKNALYFGGRLGYHWPKWLGVEAAAGFSPTKEDIAGGQDLDFWHGSGNVLIKPFSGRYGWPFVSVGAGASQLKQSSSSLKDTQGNAEAGVGAQFWLSDAVGIRIEARDLMWLPRKDPGNIRAHTYVAGAGLTFTIGARPRDTDADGVPDRKDGCPETTAGCKVDDKGCPLDSDGDGVCDGIDQCPDSPKGCLVDARGCPLDADGDGVCDGIDQCANTPKGAKVDAKGCPLDSDGDAVFDGLDQCPDSPKGCRVDAKGCPVDSDGDGVCDGVDKCPDTPANVRVDKDGCPIEVTEKETELLDTGMIRLQNVQFDTGKADLKPEALPQLDIVGQVLSKWPELRIEIGGHTDSRGSAGLNQKLSEARVKSVLAYLLQKFPELKPEQYSIKGYGFSKPLVPNSSPEAMALNRRVEFLVLNKEVLKRESERRKLLERDTTLPAEKPEAAPPAPAPRETVKPAPPDTTKAAPPAPAVPDTAKGK